MEKTGVLRLAGVLKMYMRIDGARDEGTSARVDDLRSLQVGVRSGDDGDCAVRNTNAAGKPAGMGDNHSIADQGVEHKSIILSG